MAVKLRQIHFKYLVKIWFRLILSRVIALLSLLFFISSCSDQGCIEADDFGEYATQTLTISSNVNSNNCNYDSTLDLTDPSQGSGLKDCFTRGAPTIIDENGNSPVFSAPNTKGCSGLQDPTIVNAPLFKQLCVDYCVASCIEGASTGGSTSEPPWQVTASDGTMVISPLSSVLINVTGNVVLGNSLNLPSAYVGDALYGLQSSNINWDNTVIDVKNGQTRKVTFSGKWANGAGKIFGDSSNWADIANGARSLAAYVVAAPAGYDYYYSNRLLSLK